MALMQFVLGCASCAFALCAFILWMRRCDGDRSRRTLSIVWLFLALLFSGRALVDGQSMPPDVLPPVNLVGGLFMLTLLYFYPIEVIRPGWLNAQRTFYLLLPTLIMGVIFHLSGTKLRHCSRSEICLPTSVSRMFMDVLSSSSESFFLPPCCSTSSPITG